MPYDPLKTEVSKNQAKKNEMTAYNFTVTATWPVLAGGPPALSTSF